MSADRRLEGKRIVVTGAGAGIGAAIADTARGYGAEVFGADIDRSTDVNGHYDVADEADVARLFAAAVEQMGGIDGLVNNVGIAGPTGRVEDLDPAAFDHCVRVNVGSTFRCTAAAVPLMSGAGSIVNIVSTAGIFGYPLRSPYAASKWAVIGLTKTWAMELGGRGIRVNAVCPGTVEGPRMDGVIEREAAATGSTAAAIRASYTAQVSMHTLITGADIGEACCWLLSDAARYVSGQVLSVDGNTETLRTV
jgi:NAD(P)-dependent dehydrogenase (short-subunit alcohol dehydrogenase family)